MQHKNEVNTMNPPPSTELELNARSFSATFVFLPCPFLCLHPGGNHHPESFVL